MDVVFKEGMLYLQGVKFGKRSWKKIWMVLFKPSSTGVGRLELCPVLDSSAVTDQKKATRQKTAERKVVRLSDCLSVTPAPKESCPQGCTAFYLNTSQCTYTLASRTSQDWLSALCLLAFQKDPGEPDKGGLERENGLTMEDNDLYSSWTIDLTLPPKYQVTVQSTEASRRCKLAGEYLVSPDTDTLTLLTCNTGHIIYSWPYRLLRKFGKVEGGFSIQAGRRCQSGEGVFIFLTRHGPQIFQTILEQCSVEKSSPAQPPSNHRSLSDQSPVSLPTSTNRPTAPPASNHADVPLHTEEDSDSHYSTINYNLIKPPSFVNPPLSNSKDAVGEEVDDDDDEEEEERCHSLEALSLDGDTDDIYYNLRRSTPPMLRKEPSDPETEDSACIYSDLKLVDPPSISQLQPFPSPPPQLVPQAPPCLLPQSVPYMPLPRPRYQRQPHVINFIQPGFNTQALGADGMKEMEDTISSSTRATPTEAPGSFKHRLAEIISKDLAKCQPPPPSGTGSPTFSQ